MSTADDAISLVRFVTDRLVDEQEVVRCEATGSAEQGWQVELEVAPRDLGLVIGKSGRTASSLRSLLVLLARQRGERIRLHVVGEEKPPKKR